MSSELLIETRQTPDDAVAVLVARGQRPIDSLQVMLDKVVGREILPGNWSGLQMMARESAHLGGAVAKLQLAQIAAALALARLRQRGPTQHILVERCETRQLAPPSGAGVHAV